jgi:heme a synthase
LAQTVLRRTARLLAPHTLNFWAWASLISQILIVVTGGVVRLSGSGLGCPTWPKCTDASLVTVPAQGYHGVIEFTNRMLTFALTVIAIATLVVVFRKGVDRALRVRTLAVLLFLGIPAQAVLGGFTVLFKLNPWFVGGHFVLSAILIVLATVLVWRAFSPAPAVVPRRAYVLAPWIWALGMVAVVIGVLVTGAGPHAGDAQSVRNGLNLETLEHLHSYPAYALLALTVVQFFTLRRADRAETGQTGRSLPTVIVSWLLVVLLAQVVVGVAQARLGVPVGLVEIHMLLASCLISLVTFHFLSARVK